MRINPDRYRGLDGRPRGGHARGAGRHRPAQAASAADASLRWQLHRRDWSSSTASSRATRIIACAPSGRRRCLRCSYAGCDRAATARLDLGRRGSQRGLGASAIATTEGNWLADLRNGALAVPVGGGCRGKLRLSIRSLRTSAISTGLLRYASNARRDGFSGMLAIHPAQVEVINAAFRADGGGDRACGAHRRAYSRRTPALGLSAWMAK